MPLPEYSDHSIAGECIVHQQWNQEIFPHGFDKQGKTLL
jgi:hypothetical protein